METYIIVMFILYISSIGIKLAHLNSGVYPRIYKISKGADIIYLIFMVIFAVWTGYLIF